MASSGTTLQPLKARTDMASASHEACRHAEAVLKARLEELLARSRSVATAGEQLAIARQLTEGRAIGYQNMSLLLQIQERARKLEGLAEGWQQLFEVMPNDRTVLRHHLLWLTRQGRGDLALELLDRWLPENLERRDIAFTRAQILDEIGQAEAADALFARLVERYQNRHAIRIDAAKRLLKRGWIIEARAMIAPSAQGSSAAGRKLAADIEQTCAMMLRYEPEEALRGTDYRLFALKHAIRHFRGRDRRREVAHEHEGVALVTGSLGPGGAERQMTRLACHLQRDYLNERKRIEGPVEVIVKSHRKSIQASFFLPDLAKCGVPVSELDQRTPVAARKQALADPELVELLGHMPPQVHYGVTRLAPLLAERPREVVSLWQDGACLIGALAALIVGTPNIQLMFRGLPPNIRRDRFKPEYVILYRELARLPGVQFVSNSRAAAAAYAEWLDLPLDRFHVLYNGVPPLSTDGSEADERAWESFAARTADATETIGGVFRFESDKQPSRWIDLAHRYLKRRPTARFVIVGHGRLFDTVRDRAIQHGIADRILFVGHSTNIGFWYSKMDVKVLLSRYEGLPNVLIEAQYLGIPVVTTPAGGSAETLLEERSGVVLGSADEIDYDEACAGIERMLASRDDPERGEAMSHVALRFSVAQFVDNFAALAVGR
ncbi:glycosyltransferase [Sphingomicrobium astaxanthinifaciens]|uniref:glycosyltransferase n=1 Tax=Sphingomicrobium astaxanthinifaciens TaxID=1227949 RepID=UPI001FCB9FD0|nr:glycosyltransferase [Sphingomicrobium astaxanthinifaciens]MCJ7420792.1 glycosyltransferase [Sphingomicrobium astaxanthinifaciens]